MHRPSSVLALNSAMPTRLFYLLLVLIWAHTLHGQDRVPVEIINANSGTMLRTDSTTLQILSGNVKLKQEKMFMRCDSAVLYQKFNRVEAFGHVFIQQGDSVQVNSEYLRYDGNKRLAWMTGNVQLRDDKMIIRTPSLAYDVKQKKGTYTQGAVIQNGGDQTREQGGILLCAHQRRLLPG